MFDVRVSFDSGHRQRRGARSPRATYISHEIGFNTQTTAHERATSQVSKMKTSALSYWSIVGADAPTPERRLVIARQQFRFCRHTPPGSDLGWRGFRRGCAGVGRRSLTTKNMRKFHGAAGLVSADCFPMPRLSGMLGSASFTLVSIAPLQRVRQ